MRVYTITASGEELAGDGLVAFAGFFDRKFRVYDYNAGRHKARLFLDNLKAVVLANPNRGDLPLTDFSLPDDMPPGETSLATASISDVDVQIRKAIYERLSDRVSKLLEQYGINVIVRKLAMWIVINRKIKKLLALSC